MSPSDHLASGVTGLALGDALGLPFEGLSRRKVTLRICDEPMRHRLIFGRGMVSDDSDHAELVLIAIARSAAEPRAFARELARGLRGWFLALPAGIGLATARSCIKLCIGINPAKSGINSAGNGPLMRAPILGALPLPWDRIQELTDISTRITHTDARAVAWARIIAWTTSVFRREQLDLAEWLDAVRRISPDATCTTLCENVAASVTAGTSTESFASSIGCTDRVSGFVMHTGPVVCHAALKHSSSVEDAIIACIRCGGDTDTTAAIAGGIVGARVGVARMNTDLLNRIWDWPRGLDRLRQFAHLASEAAQSRRVLQARSAMYPLRLTRNLVFLGVILTHVGHRVLLAASGR